MREIISRDEVPFGDTEPSLNNMLTQSLKRDALIVSGDWDRAVIRSNVFMILVSLKTHAEGIPDLYNLISACRSLGTHLRPGSLVIF